MTKPETKMRVVDASPETFAKNLDDLIRLAGHSRKSAAEAVGVTHKLIRRYVSAGIGRPDYRSQEGLQKIATYFALPNVRSLWREHLAESLLTTDDGRGFVKKFRKELEKRRVEERSKTRDSDERRLECLDRALTLRLEPSRTPLTCIDKARTVLEQETPKRAAAFRVMVDLFYDALELKRTGS